MSRERRLFIAMNVLGGVAVLGSYAWGLSSRPDAAAVLWGGVPEALRGLYTVNMFAAAAGYFLFSAWFLRVAEPRGARFLGGRGFGAVNACYALVLFPSALWLPLTLRVDANPSALLWWATRLDLFAVGAGSLGLLALVLSASERGPRLGWALALLGLLPFCLQTAVLDALVWPACFPR